MDAMSDRTPPSHAASAATFPTLMRRYVSTSLDLFALLLAVGAVQLLPLPATAKEDLLPAVFVACWWIYEPLMVWRGATLGQALTGIRVRRMEDTRRPVSLVRSYVRFLLKYTLGLVSWIMILLDARSRAIHDMVARSIVVRAAPDGAESG